ncbi:MAG: alpha/beta fold hydrolase, partial [Myxococcota bacterium]
MRPVPDLERHHTVVSDGVRLAVHRYPPRAGSPRRRFPVLCCHGLGANRLAFDLREDVSLARYLAGQGYDVFVLELRGHGHSEVPAGRSWGLREYLERDVRGVAEAILQIRGGRGRADGSLHFIGHSMGGVLGLALAAESGDSILKSVAAIGAALDYSVGGSGFRALLPFRPLIERLPEFPIHRMARLSSVMVGWVRTPYETFNVCPGNTEPELWRQLCRQGFHGEPTAVLADLASGLEGGGVKPPDGGPTYLARLARRTDQPPILCVAGDRDAQCPPAAVKATHARLAKGELLEVGRASGAASH